MKHVLLSYFILLFFCTSQLPAQNEAVAHINPLTPGLLRFLDSDLEEFNWRAGQAYRKGDYLNAARWYIAVVRFRTNASLSLYNLACCYGKLNQPEQASQTLWQAILAGFDNFKLAQTDADFETVRDHASFKTVLQRISQVETQVGTSIYVPARKAIPCRLHLPEGYQPDKAYPLVLALHGHGSRSENMAAVYKLFNHPQFIFAAPQATYDAQRQKLTKTVQKSWTLTTPDSTLWAQTDPLTLQSIEDIIVHMKKSYKISSIFILGFSQGAAIAYGAGIHYHAQLDGILCFGGQLPATGHPYSLFSEEDLTDAKSLPVFIAHGKKDQAIKIQAGKNSKKRLQAKGFNVTFHAFDGGHSMDAHAVEKAQQWISRIVKQEK